jgi:hypothetical protein
MRSKAAFIVELFLSRHPSDDQISRLRLPLWASTGETEPIAVMLRHINAGDIGALRAACSDLISDNSGSNSPSGTPIKSITYGESAALEAVFFVLHVLQEISL